jgi:dienelactone hydrolase
MVRMPLRASARTREAEMQSPVAVRVEGVPLSVELEQEIARETEVLERFHDRITSCRVVVSTPHRRHRRGRVWHVRIDLNVPGAEIVVGREPGLDPGHEDLGLALRDAFRAARRQLRDHVRKVRGFDRGEAGSTEAAHATAPVRVTPEEHGRREVAIQAGGVQLRGWLTVPPGARAMVLFTHGSGSGRSSPRSAYVAGVLQSAHMATLLTDLLSWEESRDPRRLFDDALLAQRLLQVVRWVKGEPYVRDLRLGLHAANTGVAATLIAAADEPEVGALVLRGGRPDQAGPALPFVAAPTLLLVGADDARGLQHCHAALRELRCPHELVVVAGAGYLFEEHGVLREAARRTREWFERQLAPPEY